MKFSGCSASIIIDYDNTLYIGHLGDSKGFPLIVLLILKQ